MNVLEASRRGMSTLSPKRDEDYPTLCCTLGSPPQTSSAEWSSPQSSVLSFQSTHQSTPAADNIPFGAGARNLMEKRPPLLFLFFDPGSVAAFDKKSTKFDAAH
jgi:hypothetical protein